MTDPSQYFKGRTVQEQMTEVIGYVDTRAAEVATDAIASDVAQVHQDMLDADADASAAAASAAAAAGTLANAVKKTGESTQNIEGDITLSTGDFGVAGDAGVQGQLSVLGGCDLRSTVKVPTVTTGTFDDNAANGNKVKNELDNYAAMVRTGGNQTISGTKTFTSMASGLMTYGTADTSSALNVGDYKAIYRIARSGLSTFRGVCSILVWQRAAGDSCEIINVAFHGNTAVGIFRFGFGTKTCEYFVSADNDYVYIGVKALYNTLTASSKQMFVLGAVGFNQSAVFESYVGTPAATPEGSLIAETS